MLMQMNLVYFSQNIIPLFFIFLIGVTAFVIIWIVRDLAYRHSPYYQVTGRPYFLLRRDIGSYGEYLTYKNLASLEAQGARFLFNVYIPKTDGGTTEIDVLMITPKGIFVFESKNYSGWIFGSEDRKDWYQTLPTGRGRSHKEVFYNPILQNRSHIKHLQALLGEKVPMWSIIAFSDRCTFKNVKVRSRDVRVVHRTHLLDAVLDVCNQMQTDLLSGEEVGYLYDVLYPFSQVDEKVKIRHVLNILDKQMAHPAPHTPLTKPSLQNVSQPVMNEQSSATDPSAMSETETSCSIAEAVEIPSKASDEEYISEEALKSNFSEVEATEDEKIDETALQNESESKNETATKSELSPNTVCPECGGTLILKVARRGAHIGNRFYGCSNYPKCKFIKNITPPDV